MNPAKIPFWQLTLIFLLITGLAITSAWSSSQVEEANMMTQMMGSSMGDMMKMMHASNITLVDLLVLQADEKKAVQPKSQQAGFLDWVNTFTTNIVFLLTPIILCGTIFLFIVWYC